jgi:hypothetical protein
MIPSESWVWIGLPGHFIGGAKCVFHLCTVVGDIMVSTVGNYQPDGKRLEVGWLRDYETMAWKISGWQNDYPAIDHNEEELIMYPANSAIEARRNHMRACWEFARNQEFSNAD